MNGPGDMPHHQSPKEWLKALPGNLWKKLLDHFTGIVFGAMVTLATAAMLYVNDLLFDPARSRTLSQQDKFGMYCLNTFFASARADGATLDFDPPRLENTGICGQPPTSGDLKDRDVLGSVFTGQLEACMDATQVDGQQHSWKIRPKTEASGKLSRLTVDDAAPFFACNCSEAQSALLAFEKKGRPWCGNEVLPAEGVRPELRTYSFNW